MTLVDYLRDALSKAGECNCSDWKDFNLPPRTQVIRLIPCRAHPNAPSRYVVGGFIEPAPRRSWLRRSK